MKMKWLAHFRNVQKERAMRYLEEQSAVDYGEIIYRSSEFSDRRWLVANYLEEYNVFVEFTTSQQSFERRLAATFNNKERAIGFAAEMFLICCGRLRRKNWHEHNMQGCFNG